MKEEDLLRWYQDMVVFGTACMHVDKDGNVKYAPLTELRKANNQQKEEQFYD